MQIENSACGRHIDYFEIPCNGTYKQVNDTESSRDSYREGYIVCAIGIKPDFQGGLQDVSFQVTFSRGAEWAATARVKQKNTSSTSYRNFSIPL